MSARRRRLPPMWPWTREELSQWTDELRQLNHREDLKVGSIEHVLCRAVATALDVLRELDAAMQKIERYEKALTFYADPNNYDPNEPAYGAGRFVTYAASFDSSAEYDFEPDGGDTAREALGAHIREILVRRDGES